MQLNIRTFGIARDICGGAWVTLEVPDNATARDVQQLLAERWPPLANLASFLLAVNEEFAEPDTPIAATDEVAVIPPVSGG